LWQVFIVGASDTLSVRTPIVNSRETIHIAATDDWDAK